MSCIQPLPVMVTPCIIIMFKVIMMWQPWAYSRSTLYAVGVKDMTESMKGVVSISLPCYVAGPSPADCTATCGCWGIDVTTKGFDACATFIALSLRQSQCMARCCSCIPAPLQCPTPLHRATAKTILAETV